MLTPFEVLSSHRWPVGTVWSSGTLSIWEGRAEGVLGEESLESERVEEGSLALTFLEPSQEYQWRSTNYTSNHYHFLSQANKLRMDKESSMMAWKVRCGYSIQGLLTGPLTM